MSKHIEAFREKLYKRLNDVDAHIQELKASAKVGTEKADQVLNAQAARLRAGIDAGRASVEAAETRMKVWAGAKKASLDQKVDHWKADREAEQLKRRADEAEEYASDALTVAVAAIDEAQRIDADAAGAPVKRFA